MGWVVSSKNVSGELMRSQSRIRGRAFQAEPAASKEVLRLEQVWQGLPMQLGCGEQADSGLRYSERNGQARWLGACELRGEAWVSLQV